MNSLIPPDRSPPSAAAIALATAIIAAVGGYFIGQASSIGIFSSQSSPTNKKKPSKKSWPNSYDVTIHPDSSDEELMTQLRGGDPAGHKIVADSEDEDDGGEESDEDEDDFGELKYFERSSEEFKLVLCVRTDLGMGKGKIAAQCSHATLQNYKAILSAQGPQSPVFRQWEHFGQAKIALQVGSQDQMDELQARAMSLGLCARVVRDAGRTQIAAGSATVLGVGPGPKSVVDEVTGSLKLL